MKERVAIAKRTRADLFISIHTNVAGKAPTTKTGFEVYVAAERSKNTHLTRSRIAGSALLNSVEGIYASSKELRTIPAGPGIYVLDKAVCPAFLIECGYINNPQDLAFVTKAENQNLIAKKNTGGGGKIFRHNIF